MNTRHWFRLLRVPNLLMVWCSQLFTIAFLLYANPFGLNYWPIMAASVLIAAGGYVINDYFDVKIDAVNRPNQVIIDFYLGRRKALFLYAALTAAGLLVSVSSLNLFVVLITASNAALLFVYSAWLKRRLLVGNIAVALLTASVVLILLPISKQNTDALLTYGLFAFYITFIREIIKDMEDIRGDKRYGCQTLPVLYGLRVAKRVVFLLTGLFAISALYLSYLFDFRLMLAMGLVILSCFVLLFRLYFADTRARLSRVSLYSKLIMLLGILTMPVV